MLRLRASDGYPSIYSHESWDEVSSLYRRFISDTLKLVARHPNFTESVKRSNPGSRFALHLEHFTSELPSPWIPLSEIYLQRLKYIINKDMALLGYWEREKHRLSAAAVATCSMKFLPLVTHSDLCTLWSCNSTAFTSDLCIQVAHAASRTSIHCNSPITFHGFQKPILEFSKDLRNCNYSHYFIFENGLFFDYETTRLAASCNMPLHLNL
jgi:hypothetical protein